LEAERLAVGKGFTSQVFVSTAIELVGTNRCYVGRSVGVGERLWDHAKGATAKEAPELQASECVD
jgi:hypothetical protein